MPHIDYPRLLVIVTGIELAAELGDRPLAYGLQQHVQRLVRSHVNLGPDLSANRVVPTAVISDALYLNDERLQQCTTLSIGGPGVNSVTATLTEELPTAAAIDDTLIIQMAMEPDGPRQCTVWGMDHLETIRAVDLFIKRGYLDRFVRNHIAWIGEPESEPE